jgi:glucose-1-phosphate cytidylyltransferase
MKVVILCGGQGTRLREETEFRPKPLVLVGDRPVVWHIMKLFSHAGIREFVLCLGYRGNMIKEYFLNYEAMTNDFTICLGKQNSIDYHDAHEEQDFRVSLAETGLNTMTGGRLKRVARYIDSDTFMLTYGDGLADVDIPALLAFHHSHGKIGTVTTVRPISRFGILDVEGNGQVSKFAEKPQASGWASAGYFVFNRRILNYLENESDDCVLERGPLERLTADGELMAYRHDGFFFAMDTFREYQYLNELWASGNAPWKLWK